MIENYEAPLVTFALFAYNQEQYIREAVEAALSQDYTPLEIIISDDCSADETFSVIQQVVKSYKGPHQVRVRQTEKNCGSLLHVQDVAKSASGKLLVLAAGDDVSKPTRTRVLQEAWQKTGAWGLCSRFDRIDENGAILAEGMQAAVVNSRTFDRFFVPDGLAVRIVHGCTSAYDTRLFNYLKLQSTDYVLSEDGALSVLLNIIGKDVAQLEDSLVLYRQSSNSLTNNIRKKKKLTYAEIVRDENNIKRFAFSQANRCRLFLRMNEYLVNVKTREISTDAVRIELHRQEILFKWFDLPIKDRLSAIFRGNVMPKWAVPRLFGRNMFYLLKSIGSLVR
jgi:glycosyltransferase involved in cell wall biosynthesis